MIFLTSEIVPKIDLKDGSHQRDTTVHADSLGVAGHPALCNGGFLNPVLGIKAVVVMCPLRLIPRGSNQQPAAVDNVLSTTNQWFAIVMIKD